MAKMTPEQEAAYALDYNVSRSDLSAGAQLAYDRLRAEHENRRGPTSAMGPADGRPASQQRRTLVNADSPELGHCPNCTAEMPAEPCVSCGWQRGLVPIARTGTGENEVTTFSSERRSRGRLLCGLFACAAGAVLLIWGFSTGGGAIAAGIILGPAFLVAGIATLKITRFGRVWWGLPAGDKGWAVPGLVVGAGAMVLALPATLLALAIVALYFGAIGDIRRSL